MVVLPFSPRNPYPDWVNTVAIGNYRCPFSVIEELSRLLAPVVIATGVVPVIIPFPQRAFTAVTVRTPIVRHMVDDGYLLFDGGIHDDHH